MSWNLLFLVAAVVIMYALKNKSYVRTALSSRWLTFELEANNGRQRPRVGEPMPPFAKPKATDSAKAIE